MPKMIFVNLPAANLDSSVSFYEALGCHKHEQFSNDQAASMVWSDTITFQLLARDYFSTFISKPVADARSACEVLLALSCDSRDQVDSTVEAAAAAGGKADVRDKMDLGFLYNRAIEDPDAHVLELIWMDMSAMPEQPQ